MIGAVVYAYMAISATAGHITFFALLFCFYEGIVFSFCGKTFILWVRAAWMERETAEDFSFFAIAEKVSALGVICTLFRALF